MTLVSNDAKAPSLDPLASFDLDTLIGGAARLRADRLALADCGDGEMRALTFAELDRRVSALAEFWLNLGLKPRARILVAGGAVGTSVIALIAAARAGFDIAFAPLHLCGEEIVDFASDIGAELLAAETHYGELSPVEELLSVAAQVAHVRFVCSLGGGHVDGAVDADPAMIAPSPRSAWPTACDTHIFTRTRTGEIVQHRQRTLVAAALDLVTRARIGMRLPVLSTLAPATFAGLVAGPIAALLAGAPLILLGPFSTECFNAMLQRSRPAHLVAPAAMLPALQSAGLLSTENLATLILVSRLNDFENPRGPALARTESERAIMPPIVDLFAIDEQAAVPEVRKFGGDSALALAEPHYIALEDRQILAVGRSSDRGFEGAAVSPL